MLTYLKQRKELGDLLYLHHGSGSAFKYYSARYGLDGHNYVEGISSRGDWRGYARYLDRLRGNKRVWILFSHVLHVEEKQFFLYYLDSLGKRLDSFIGAGAEVYLYDLTEESDKVTWNGIRSDGYAHGSRCEKEIEKLTCNDEGDKTFGQVSD